MLRITAHQHHPQPVDARERRVRPSGLLVRQPLVRRNDHAELLELIDGGKAGVRALVEEQRAQPP